MNQQAKCPPCPGDPKGTGFCEFHECERDCQTVDPFPAVPTQEAPRERICKNCGRPIWLLEEGPDRPAMWLHKGGYGPQCPIMAEPQAGAQVPSQEAQWQKRCESAIFEDAAQIEKLQDALDHIRNYAVEAAKTPITRESILAAPQVDDAPIPDDLRKLYYLANDGDGYPVPAKTVTALIEQIARLEAALEARKLTELAQYDEMQGLCRLILSESGGGE
jgi:hypothetical protein